MESRAFSLPAQSVPSGGGGGSGGTGGGSSRAAALGAAHIAATVMSCLMGRVLLLEIFMAAVLTLNANLGKHSLFLYNECLHVLSYQ